MSRKLTVIFTFFVSFLVFLLEEKAFSAETESHRTRRSASSAFRTAQPTKEFPLVLFERDNYNNGSERLIKRSRPNEYRVWARTLVTEIQEFVFRSLLLLPGWKLTFQACCLAGNQWTVSVANVTSISSLHYYMFDNREIGEAIYYTQWLHWSQDFSVKAEECLDSDLCSSNITCAKTCYFGSCGLDSHCQCKDGYSGDQCEIHPSPPDLYPNITFPLVLFKKKDFKGSHQKVPPNSYHAFAKNAQNERTFVYLSARVLFTRSVTFSRNKEDDQRYTVSPGSDINDLESFFASNMEIGQPLWMNYAKTIESQFYMKVEDNMACTNCSQIGGCCYSGSCVCLPGYNGTDCSNTVP